MKQENENIWVFLSHSNKDYEKVRIVRNYLEERQFRPIMFYLKCLDDDVEVDELVKREIDSRNRFILCDSYNAKRSKWVQTEVKYIKSKNRMYQIVNLDKDMNSIKHGIDEFIFKSSVFVSYSHHDEKYAKKIMKELKKWDFHILNNDYHDKLSSGDLCNEIKKTIEEAVNDGFVLVLISRFSIKSEWILKEIRYALELAPNTPNVIPIAIDNILNSDERDSITFLFNDNSAEKELLIMDVSKIPISDVPVYIAKKLYGIYSDYVPEKVKTMSLKSKLLKLFEKWLIRS